MKTTLDKLLRITVLVMASGTLAQAQEPSLSETLAAIRSFRIKVYNEHRTNRNQYDQLIEKSNDLLSRLRDNKITSAQVIEELHSSIEIASEHSARIVVQPPFVSRHRRPGPVTVHKTLIAVPVPTPVVAVDPNSSQTSPTVESAQTSSPTHSVSTKRTASVNLAVLAARIESTNLTLETIEGQLNRDSQRLFPDELRALVLEVEEALRRQEMSATYLNLLSEDEKDKVTAMVSPEPVISLLVKRLFEAQIVAHERLTSSGLSDDKETLKALQEMTQKVRQWQVR